jgi:hypothetical protein
MSKTSTRSKERKSRLIFPDGHEEEYEPTLAYRLWLTIPGTALRTPDDNRPVYAWDQRTTV